MKNKKGILFVINDFNIGGAELFVLRLGKALSMDYRIYILDIYPESSDAAFKSSFQEMGFTLIERYSKLTSLREKFYWKLNSLFQLLGKKGIFSVLKKRYEQRSLQKALLSAQIQIVHSHYFSADDFVRNNLLHPSRKWVITMHGDYNLKVLESLSKTDREEYLKIATTNIEQCDVLTHVADVNLELLQKYHISTKHLQKIRLGLEFEEVIGTVVPVDKDVFTFCMVARSNPDKGWQLMVDAFCELNAKFPKTHLICVGPLEGVVKELAKQHASNASIEFTGYTNSPHIFVQRSQVGVLPTYFEGESSPYSVVEYLCYGKPVISTEKGEIPDMLNTNGKLAGIVIPNDQKGKPDKIALVNAMEKLVLDLDHYKELQALTRPAFEKFTMDRCKKAYKELYESEKKS